jgi:hypothetical protein
MLRFLVRLSIELQRTDYDTAPCHRLQHLLIEWLQQLPSAWFLVVPAFRKFDGKSDNARCVVARSWREWREPRARDVRRRTFE